MNKKNIVIIGASKGIGKACLDLLIQNHQIWSFSRSEINVENTDVQHHILDVTQDDWSEVTLPEVIDGLVYLPGSIVLKPFNRLTLEDFKNDWEINFLGAVKSIQKLIPHLKKSSGASVVLFSSVAAKVGMPFHASIASAKAAIEGLTKSLAAEYAVQNIRFNAIAPSLTDTSLASGLLSTDAKRQAAAERHPLKKIGNPDDFATLVDFLLSEQSQWITGQIFSVDGGMSTLKL